MWLSECVDERGPARCRRHSVAPSRGDSLMNRSAFLVTVCTVLTLLTASCPSTSPATFRLRVRRVPLARPALRLGEVLGGHLRGEGIASLHRSLSILTS